jgi:D-aminopeptidase
MWAPLAIEHKPFRRAPGGRWWTARPRARQDGFTEDLSMLNRRAVLGSFAALGAAGAAQAAEPVPAGPGPRNLITDVPGLKVGQAQDAKVRTGVTVILPDAEAVCAVDVRGGGPATRETDVLRLENLVQTVDAIVLSGGSVYGLASADSVAAWLGARKRGFQMMPSATVPPSPIVPTACLYDLANGGDKAWGESPPYQGLALKALEAAGDRFALGSAGAGTGADSGGIKGGVGSASVVSADGMTVGAIVAVNSMGSAVAPGSKRFWAAPYEIGKEFGGLGPVDVKALPDDWAQALFRARARANTTIACVATDVVLNRAECQRIAIMAQDGMARALRPVHSPFDGDLVFAMSTGKREISGPIPRQFVVARLGALAADTLARAIARAVYEATAWPGDPVKAWRDL